MSNPPDSRVIAAYAEFASISGAATTDPKAKLAIPAIKMLNPVSFMLSSKRHGDPCQGSSVAYEGGKTRLLFAA